MLSAITKMIEFNHVITVSNLRINSRFFTPGWLFFDVQIDGEKKTDLRERCEVFKSRNYSSSILLSEDLETGSAIFEILRENIPALEIKTSNVRDVLLKFFMIYKDATAEIKSSSGEKKKIYKLSDLIDYMYLKMNSRGHKSTVFRVNFFNGPEKIELDLDYPLTGLAEEIHRVLVRYY